MYPNVISMDINRKNNTTVVGNVNASQTIVFAHGFGTDQSAWNQVAPSFESDYRVILYDNVGGGDTPEEAFNPNRYSSLEAYASDLIDICRYYKVENGILVAHSVSAMIGILASNREPSIFSKLVLVGGSPRYLNDTDYIGGFDQHELDALYDTMANNYFAWISGFSAMAMGNPDRPTLAEKFCFTLSKIRPDIAQSVVKVIFQSDYRSQLEYVTKPTLIIQAHEDLAVPMAVAEYLNRHIRNSELAVVDATGHFPHISAPDEVTKAIKSFI